MNNLKQGKTGEVLAEKYLKKQGYKIIKTNYKNKIGEIDIICYNKKDDEIVFVEVKSRTSDLMGLPSEAVDIRKQKKIRDVASLYLILNKKFDDKVRFDVIEILNGEISHIKYAF